ncbi:MAG: hypothetical protein HY303_01975 [Candidatus Wallbacteria bacterium]|nr:hypothetical protein [Candidatus Wallbacteria bacterium]
MALKEPDTCGEVSGGTERLREGPTRLEAPPQERSDGTRTGGAGSSRERNAEGLRRRLAWTHGLGLALALVPFVLYHGLASRLAMPGLLDPLYYHHVAQSLESGDGLEVPYLWNYAMKPADLAHPSNAYWGPLPSVLMAWGHAHPAPRPWPPVMLFAYLAAAFLATAGGLKLLRVPGRKPYEPGGQTWPRGLATLAAPAVLLLDLTALLGPSTPLHPHVEAMLAVSGAALHLAFVAAMLLLRDSRAALASCAFLFFCYPFTYFSVTTDSPVPFAAVVSLALLLTVLAGRWNGALAPAAAGVCCAAAALTRAEGVFLVLFAGWHVAAPRSEMRWLQRGLRLLPLLLGFLLAMAPWWQRNRDAFGTPFPSSAWQAMTMLDYNEMFYWRPRPASSATALATAAALAREKLHALLASAQTLAMGDLGLLIVLVPFGLKRACARPAGRLFAAFAIFQVLVLSLCFSFQTLNGTFLHSVVALYPFFFACAAAGVSELSRLGETALRAPGPRRLWCTLSAAATPALVLFLAVSWHRSTAGDRTVPELFADTRQAFVRLDEWCRQELSPEARLMTNLPFETYHFTRRPCAILPRDQDFAAIAEVAGRYRIAHLAILDNPKYLRHPMQDDRIALGTRGELALEGRIPLSPGPAGFREIRMYRITLRK